MNEYKYYIVDDVILTVPSDKEMKGFKEVPSHLIENKENEENVKQIERNV